MFTWMWIFEIVLFSLAGPDALAYQDRYTCEQFETGAYFDPYQVIDSMWKIFYFWANTTELYPIVFSLPAKQRIQKFREVLDSIEPDLGVEWHKATLIMVPRPGVQVLMLYAGTPGAFRAIILLEHRKSVRPRPCPLMKMADIRLKLVDRVMGMMACEEMTVYALSRMNEMPETEVDCKKAAAILGLNMKGGHSHLYVANLTRRNIIDDEL